MEQFFLGNTQKIKRILKALKLRPGERVLELGAGAGTFAAAMPRHVQLSLVEIDPELAEGLRARFPWATVHEEDALELLAALPFDVLLSNLPHALSAQVLAQLKQRTFRRAAVAIRAGQVLKDRETFRARPLLQLAPEDFTPQQPFASLVLLLEPKNGPKK